MSKGIDKDIRLGRNDDHNGSSPLAWFLIIIAVLGGAALGSMFPRMGNPTPPPRLDAISLEECVELCGDAGIAAFARSPHTEICHCHD
jgi:hypothetical protein